ncbi:F0F1 ATP synthase subunit delta [Tessaracoccus sp. MC1865]|uniref:F0F1 ATP synthase subunit delta n=1 Tax=Tessaracoccus sp. MC1865 TaxID=2760310 RepID=UPI0016006532|nr:F0F1 ATP synthase subunit delta [Tessaracoccus sp. MC1865]MBB1483454.1 F0F1 ATP synthase subunit delta [Tessaracoccus sp. MC1865]QTO36554.1 F0F1 ATP synthase subunit delta [Tessaracoccus sp. MC1865]
MTVRDVAYAALDSEVAGISTDAGTAEELFAVVDLLDGQPTLRRSLSDPSASEANRAHLAERLLGGKISQAALDVVVAIVKHSWNSGNRLVGALERQGIRLVLRSAHREGRIDEVTGDLYQLSVTVDANRELAGALRNAQYPLEGKRHLINRLVSGKVHPATAMLASRAAKARKRTFALTAKSYVEMGADIAGEEMALVTVARPLDPQRVARLKSALERQVGGPVNLQIEVDPAVLGGMSVVIGDDVIESTVAARLEDARRQLTTF